MDKIHWQVKKFKELSLDEYFEIISLRTKIFVVEQNCPYQEVDEYDPQAIHLFGRTENHEVIAVSRILPPGLVYEELSVGRVAVSKEFRGKGIAKILMEETLKAIQTEFGERPIRISAQHYLLNFYAKFGFKGVGKKYLEDGIPHIEMLYHNR